MMHSRKPRVALCVFKDSADCMEAVEVLDRLGCAREAMLMICQIGKPALRTTFHWVDGAWCETGMLPANLSRADRIADFDHWATPKLSADLHVFLDQGGSILLARLGAELDEAYVTGLLLRTAALTVQLHDLSS